MDRTRKKVWIFGVLSLAAIAFIFVRSLQPAQESDAESYALVDMLRGFLSLFGNISDGTWNGIIRKAAHFLEFMALGGIVGGFTISLGALRGRTFGSMPLLVCLLVATCDETLQTFVAGRFGSPRDVVLDFFGSAAGLLLAAAVHRWRCCRRKRTKKNGNGC